MIKTIGADQAVSPKYSPAGLDFRATVRINGKPVDSSKLQGRINLEKGDSLEITLPEPSRNGEEWEVEYGPQTKKALELTRNDVEYMMVSLYGINPTRPTGGGRKRVFEFVAKGLGKDLPLHFEYKREDMVLARKDYKIGVNDYTFTAEYAVFVPNK